MHDPKDVAILSRVRLMRNIQNLPFPSKMNEQDAAQVHMKAYQALRNAGKAEEFAFVKMSDIPAYKRYVLLEKGMISLHLACEESGAALIRRDGKVSLMMNEEDHICIKSIQPGCSVMAAADEALALEKAASPHLQYAYDEQFGFLTSSPAMAGTGLSASVLMHLPGCVRMGKMAETVKELSAHGLMLKGLYRQEIQPTGELFWLSNRVAIGRTEQEILDTLEMAAWDLVEKERKEREKLLTEKRLSMEDRAMRSYGILQYARKMDEKEFLRRWSDVRLAVLSGTLRISLKRLDDLLQKAQKGHLSAAHQKELSGEEADIARAQLLRDELER